MATAAESAPLLLPSSSSSGCRSVRLAVHDVDNGGSGKELMEPTYEVASVGKANASLYPEDFPYKNVVDFTIEVNKARQWRSTPVSSSSGRPLGGGGGGGLIEDSTERRSFSIPFYEFLFSTCDADQGVARLRRHVALTNVVRMEYCELVAEALFTTGSEYIKAMVNKTYNKLCSFVVKVEVEVVETIEYKQIENRGRKRKGLLH